MTDAPTYTRASKIRRFGPLAATSGNRSYFAGREGASSADQKDDLRPRSPLLPNDVQRSLLHVGMRVRKSVPGGYRTGAETFDRAIKAQAEGNPFSVANSKAETPTAAKKRSLDDSTDSTSTNTPTWHSDLTIQTVLELGPVSRQFGHSKVRRFAIPKSRKARPWPEMMDVDTQQFVDENGDFKDADFLEL
jgi:hypothetical protein